MAKNLGKRIPQKKTKVQQQAINSESEERGEGHTENQLQRVHANENSHKNQKISKKISKNFIKKSIVNNQTKSLKQKLKQKQNKNIQQEESINNDDDDNNQIISEEEEQHQQKEIQASIFKAPECVVCFDGECIFRCLLLQSPIYVCSKNVHSGKYLCSEAGKNCENKCPVCREINIIQIDPIHRHELGQKNSKFLNKNSEIYLRESIEKFINEYKIHKENVLHCDFKIKESQMESCNAITIQSITEYLNEKAKILLNKASQIESVSTNTNNKDSLHSTLMAILIVNLRILQYLSENQKILQEIQEGKWLIFDTNVQQQLRNNLEGVLETLKKKDRNATCLDIAFFLNLYSLVNLNILSKKGITQNKVYIFHRLCMHKALGLYDMKGKEVEINQMIVCDIVLGSVYGKKLENALQSRGSTSISYNSFYQQLNQVAQEVKKNLESNLVNLFQLTSKQQEHGQLQQSWHMTESDSKIGFRNFLFQIFMHMLKEKTRSQSETQQLKLVMQNEGFLNEIIVEFYKLQSRITIDREKEVRKQLQGKIFEVLKFLDNYGIYHTKSEKNIRLILLRVSEVAKRDIETKYTMLKLNIEKYLPFVRQTIDGLFEEQKNIDEKQKEGKKEFYAKPLYSLTRVLKQFLEVIQYLTQFSRQKKDPRSAKTIKQVVPYSIEKMQEFYVYWRNTFKVVFFKGKSFSKINLKQFQFELRDYTDIQMMFLDTFKSLVGRIDANSQAKSTNKFYDFLTEDIVPEQLRQLREAPEKQILARRILSFISNMHQEQSIGHRFGEEDWEDDGDFNEDGEEDYFNPYNFNIVVESEGSIHTLNSSDTVSFEENSSDYSSNSYDLEQDNDGFYSDDIENVSQSNYDSEQDMSYASIDEDDEDDEDEDEDMSSYDDYYQHLHQ